MISRLEWNWSLLSGVSFLSKSLYFGSYTIQLCWNTWYTNRNAVISRSQWGNPPTASKYETQVSVKSYRYMWNVFPQNRNLPLSNIIIATSNLISAAVIRCVQSIYLTFNIISGMLNIIVNIYLYVLYTVFPRRFFHPLLKQISLIESPWLKPQCQLLECWVNIHMSSKCVSAGL